MYGLQRERDNGRDQGQLGAQPSNGVGGRADRAGRGRERGRQRGRAVRRGGGDVVRAAARQPEPGVRGRGRAAGRVAGADRGRRGRGDAGGLGAAAVGGRRRAHQPVAARVPARRRRAATDRRRPRRRRGAGRAAGLRDAAGGQGEHGGPVPVRTLRTGHGKTPIALYGGAGVCVRVCPHPGRRQEYSGRSPLPSSRSLRLTRQTLHLPFQTIPGSLIQKYPVT